MDVLTNPVREYAWGSRTAIARLQGRPYPTDRPEAELWMGAHPHASSRVVRGGVERALSDVIAADPTAELGESTVERHGPRLPFLAKVLAAEEPLSIQVHPDADQAAAGFAAEEASGLAPGDAKRNYKDPFHKPELLCALTEFEALCGFRPTAEARRVLAGLEVAELAPFVAMLERPDGLRAACTALFEVDSPDRLVEAVRRACAAAGEFAADYALTARLGERYPGDVGVVFTLLLRRCVLAPGEAVFIPAGVPHSYVRGVGVETMACSDNVLRGGLTPKHVDVPELLRVVDFAHEPTTPVRPVALADGVVTWPSPAPEFTLYRLTVDGGPVPMPASGPRLALCTRGEVSLRAGEEVTVAAGQSVYMGAREPALEVSGAGEVFVVSTPDAR